MPTDTSVCTKRDAALRRGLASSNGSTSARSPKRMNSMLGCRSSDNSAPSTVTDGPWSPPMVSSAIRTLSGMNNLGSAMDEEHWDRATHEFHYPLRAERRTGKYPPTPARASLVDFAKY